MSTPNHTLRIRQKPDLDREVEAFLIDRQARGLASGTLRFYTQKLAHLQTYLSSQGITTVEGITAPLLRRFLLAFSRDHTPGGTHGVYRATKAFLRWYEREAEPEGWRNPIDRVQGPKVSIEPLEPVSIEDLKRMLETCRGRGALALRDKALLLFLLDTGCRAAEVIGVDVGDLDLRSGAVLVRHGKGRKTRSVFLGGKARRALAQYLRTREGEGPLFTGLHGERLRYESLRDIVRRRAEAAGIPAPTLHSFRRAFALLSLRNGVDVYSLQRLMGHADLSVLRR
jgi:site-specific recombinase XerD